MLRAGSRTRRRVPYAVFFACLAVTILPSAAGATVLAPASLSELAAGAGVVLRGRVAALTPQWRDDRRGIETVVTVEAEEYLKGSLGPEVTFTVPGGQMGPYRSIMIGAPRFVEGEQVILFLAGNAPALPHLVGFSQGVYRVRPDAAGVQRVIPGVAEPVADGTAARLASTARLSVAQFTAKLRAIVAEGRAR